MNHAASLGQGALDPERVIAEANSALEASRRLLAEHGLSSQACLDEIRKTEGPAAAERTQREIAERIHSVQTLIQDRVAQSMPGRPVSRVVAQRGAI